MKIIILVISIVLTISCSTHQKVSRVPAAALIVGRDGGVILIHKGTNNNYVVKQCQDLVPVLEERDCRLASGTEAREFSRDAIVGEIARILRLPRFKPEESPQMRESRRKEQMATFRCAESLSRLNYEIYRRKEFGAQHGFFQEDLATLESLTTKAQKISCSAKGIKRIQAEIDAINARLVQDLISMIDSDKLHTISAPQMTSKVATAPINGSEPVEIVTLEEEIRENLAGAVNVKVTNKISEISVGPNPSCVIYNNEVVCWGGSSGDSFVPKGLKNPRKVSVGTYQACVIHDEGLACWAHGRVIDVPKDVKNPRDVAVGSAICVIHDGGVKCWGGSTFGIDDVPKNVENAISVSVGSIHACAIVPKEGIVCWGGKWEGKIDARINVPKNIKNPTQISAGTYQTCAIHDDGVICWSRKGVLPISKYIHNPRHVSVGSQTCVLHDGGVKCWGNSIRDQMPENLQRPYQVSSGSMSNCALHDGGVACWGMTPWGSKNIPPLKLRFQ